TIAMGWILNVFQRSLGAIDRISEVLDADPSAYVTGVPADAIQMTVPSDPRSDVWSPADTTARHLESRRGAAAGSPPSTDILSGTAGTTSPPLSASAPAAFALATKSQHRSSPASLDVQDRRPSTGSRARAPLPSLPRSDIEV